MDNKRTKIQSKLLDKACVLGDHFVQSLNSFGSFNPDKTPFMRSGPLTCGKLHAHIPVARACYNLYSATEQRKYLDTADRLVTFFLAVLRDPVKDDDPDWYYESVYGKKNKEYSVYLSERNTMARSAYYGWALDGYAYFKKYHPHETCFDSKAEAIYRWLQFYRWDRPSLFRIGYTNGKFPDNGFSDDLRVLGTGLVRYYQICKKKCILDDAIELAEYFLAASKSNSDVGIFNEKLGTWAVSPWPITRFEHHDGVGGDQVGWGFSARGVTEFLLQLYPMLNTKMQRECVERCLSSFRWQIQTCQFENGPFGIFHRDDQWMGITAAAITNYYDLRKHDLIPKSQSDYFKVHIEKAVRWLVANSSEEFATCQLGFHRITGETDDNAKIKNGGWLVALTIETLLLLYRIGQEGSCYGN